MWISVMLNSTIAVDCPSCGYRHSVVSKMIPDRREFKCRREGCEMVWDLCPTKEKAQEIIEDMKELKRCAKSLNEIAKRVGTYGHDDDVSISKELLYG